MKITYTPSQLSTTIELDEKEKELLELKIKLDADNSAFLQEYERDLALHNQLRKKLGYE